MTIFINIAPLKNSNKETLANFTLWNQPFVEGRPRNFHVIINIAALKNPKIRQRWPILPFEINHFLQGRPPKSSCNHQHRPIKKRLKTIICALQTLFPLLKIAIFRRIAPSCSFENIFWEKFRVPSFFEWIFPKWSRQAESTPFWKWAILSEHKMRAPEKNVPSKRCFLLWKSPFSDASPPTVQDARNSLCRYNRISPSRNSLCR